MPKQLSLFDDERTERQRELVDTWLANQGIGTLLCPTGFYKNFNNL